MSKLSPVNIHHYKIVDDFAQEYNNKLIQDIKATTP